jgi:deoxyribodipyrimidine photo-lyase
MAKEEISIFWFRRDLRLEDNHGLYRALTSGLPVLPLFIFDREILDSLPAKDRRLQFIYEELKAIADALALKGSSLLVYHDSPENAWEKILSTYTVNQVFTNRDYEPYAQNRDRKIYEYLEGKGIPFKGFKDQVLFEKSEITKDDGKPYVVYTAYMKKYRSLLKTSDLLPFPSGDLDGYLKTESLHFPSLQEMGFENIDCEFPSREVKTAVVMDYHNTRDIPAKIGTSRLSLHLRFGTISIRALARETQNLNEKYFNELIWRDFYQQVLFHFPHSLDASFRPQYDRIDWEQNDEHFDAWCQGKTGYPLVDAGMRELNATGFMHNRVRMVVASFLTKHLLLHWRKGEAYFAQKLLDYDAASNVGGWQWAAGSGVDAAPYFRVFNPELQLKKFDPDFFYIKKWVEEYGTNHYPKPIIDHKFARERAIARYKATLNPA